MKGPAIDNAPAETFIAASAHLSDILASETDALNSHDLAAVQELADGKTAAAYDYEKAATAFQGWVQAGGVLSAAARDRLRVAAALLKRAATDNERRLRAAQEAHRQVIDLVRGATVSAVPAANAYGRGGAVVASRAQRSAAPSLRFQGRA